MILLRYPLSILIITFLLTGSFLPGANNLDAAAQNPTIQSVFRERLIIARSTTDSFGRKQYRGNPNMLERRVNSAIRSFLEDVEIELSTLESSMKDVEKLAASPQLVNGIPSARESWKSCLNRLRKSADDLQGSLKLVFRGSQNKAKWDSTELRKLWASTPEKEVIDWMGAAVTSICDEIFDYFFTANHTVSLSELREESPLVKLDRVAKIARYLKENF